MRRVERDQSKVLLTVEKGETKESYLKTVKTHVDEIRHMKRRQKELQIDNDKL